MQNRVLKLYVTGQMFWSKLKEEDGLDLMEYAAITGLIVLGVTASVSVVASGVNTAVTSIIMRVRDLQPVSTISGHN